MNNLRFLIRRLIAEAVATDVEKTYSIKYNTATKNYVLYKTFLDDSDYYEPVKKTVKMKDLGKDPEKAQDMAFKLVKRKLEVPGFKAGVGASSKSRLGDSTLNYGQYKGKALKSVPMLYLFDFLFYGSKFISKIKKSDEESKVYEYLTTEKLGDLKTFLFDFVGNLPKSRIIELYDSISPYEIREVVFADVLMPLLLKRMHGEFKIKFDDNGKIIMPSGLNYKVGERYEEKVNYVSSSRSRDDDKKFWWYFMDSEGNLIKFVRDTDFVSNKFEYEVTFTVISISPIKNKSTSVITSKLWSIQ
jgi:hypothetical protein